MTAEARCETAAMNTTYHEQFWVVLGTVAPVVLLADILLAAQWSRTNSLRKLEGRRGGLGAIVGALAVLAITISMGLSFFALLASLNCLGHLSDSGSDPHTWYINTIVSIFGLLGGTLFVGTYRASIIGTNGQDSPDG
jgi:hypothetical protein